MLLFMFTKILLLLLFYVVIYFYKNFIIIIILFIYFFLKIILFFHVPGCSGMFRNVPCSWFYRRPRGTTLGSCNACDSISIDR